MSAAEVVAAASRGVVAGVLLAAAAAKLRDRSGTRERLEAAGLPPGLDRTLPLVELFTALGLLIETRRAWAAYVASAMLAAFTAYIAVQIARGSAAPCPCFGATGSDRPAGVRTLVRNLVLLALAILGTGSTGLAQSERFLLWGVAATVVAGWVWFTRGGDAAAS